MLGPCDGSHVAVSNVQPHLVHAAQCSSNIKCDRMTPAHTDEPSKCFQLIQGCTYAVLGVAWQAKCGNGQTQTGGVHRPAE